MGKLEACAQKLDAAALKLDPEGRERRDKIKPRIEPTMNAQAFKTIIETWYRALDRKNVACRSKDVSESHARECSRRRQDKADVEAKLKAYLVGEGFDARDFRRV